MRPTRLAAVLGVAVAGLLAPPPAGALTLRGAVIRVGDGDTVQVLVRGVDTTVRLVGIDTPETRRPGTPVQCFGPAASARTARLLPPGAAIRLETDPTQATRDRYGRLLAYIYRRGASGATGSVNHALVASGHARVYVYRGKPFRYAATFLSAERRARARRSGVWGPACRGR